MTRFSAVIYGLSLLLVFGCDEPADAEAQLPTWFPPAEQWGQEAQLDEELERQESQLANQPAGEGEADEEQVVPQGPANLSDHPDNPSPVCAGPMCEDLRGKSCNAPGTWKQCWEDGWSHPYCFGEDALYCYNGRWQ